MFWWLWLGGVPQRGPATNLWDIEPRPVAAPSLSPMMFLSFPGCCNYLLGPRGWEELRADALTSRWVMVQRSTVAPGCSREPRQSLPRPSLWIRADEVDVSGQPQLRAGCF